MDTYFFDYESFYSTEYSLSRLDPPTYILHPLFEAICLGVAKNSDPPFVVDGPDIPQFLTDMPRDVAVVSHNALFDMCICSWRFGYVPKLIVDTLAMSRTLLQHKLKSMSLKSVGQHLGLPEKGSFLAAARGMTRADLIANGMWADYTAYNLNDVELCRMIYLRLAPLLPDDEFIVHDMVARCAVEPMFCLNTEVLAEHLAAVRAEKEQLFARAMLAGVDHKKELMSNPQFADVLRTLGVDPPTKQSLATGLKTYAFSRQDVDFMALQDHEDPRVQTVVAARLGFKSTLEETRTERMLNIANLDFPGLGINTMPIPLKVGAAITHRLGGDWLLNCQNWGRDSPIRRAVEAPDGWVIVASDAAQVEARLNAWFCGQWDLVEQFANGIDVYAAFASYLFGYEVDKKLHKGPRFIGKTSILQLGYQSAFEKFRRTVFLLSSKDGGTPIELEDTEAMRIVSTYRMKYSAISDMWKTLASVIAWMSNAGDDQQHAIGPIVFRRQEATGPNGLKLYYHNLNYSYNAQQWFYEYGGRTFNIFGGKLLENVIQFLARIAIMEAALRIQRRLGLIVRFVHQAHDELVYLCRPEHISEVTTVVTEEMCRTPDWAPGLPLLGETKTGLSYGTMEPV
jgi:DNA polymerase